MKVVMNTKPVQNAEEKPRAKFFNPLEAMAAAGAFETVSLTNNIAGQCPKCSSSMSNAFVGKEEVHYCTNCRVCEPMPIKK